MSKIFDGVLLASGGMDSTVLSYYLKKQNCAILPLFLDYGQHCRDKEYRTLKSVIHEDFRNDIQIIRIGDIYKESNSRLIKEANLWNDSIVAIDLYLPYRNLLFLAIASAFAQSKGIRTVYSAFINSNHAKELDCSLAFFTKLDALLSEYGSVKIEMPFKDMSKTQVAKLGIELQAPIEFTYSCQVNSTTPCGVCPNCVDRLEAMANLIEGR